MIFDWKTEIRRYRYYFVNLQKLTQRKDVGSFTELTFTFLVISFFLLFAIRPTFIIIAGLVKEINEKEALTEKLQSKIISLRAAQEEFSINMDRLYLVDQALPDKPDFPLLILAFEKEAALSNSQILVFSITKIGIKGESDPTKNQASIPYFEFNSTLTGEYRDLREFLTRVENLRRAINLETVSFSKTKRTDQEPSRIKLSVSGLANFFPEEEVQ